MIQKAVILAGGKGTRLASVVSDKPKPMAEVAGLPFLHYLILSLKKQGIQEVMLLVGYQKENIIDYFQDKYQGVSIRYEIEEQPRGTGGLVCELSTRWNEPILLINGDTFFDIDVQAMYQQYIASPAIHMAVKRVVQQDRYGVLSIENERIVDFNEKAFIDSGYINGGIYMIPPGIFASYHMPYSFSLEQDFFGALKSKLQIVPFYSEGYFIDIGIPDDYNLAQTTIPSLFLPKIDSSWTLFLDRDGVINEHRPADYVKNEDEFVFIDGSVEAISTLSRIFGKTIVVTNQQGIGKGMMSEYDLEKIHWKMQNRITDADGRIDRVYYCPHLASIQSNNRKPNIGMALEAQRDFPSIDFSKSIMIGDMDTDMEFGIRAGMITIKIGEPVTKKESLKFSCLRDFSLLLKNSL